MERDSRNLVVIRRVRALRGVESNDTGGDGNGSGFLAESVVWGSVELLGVERNGVRGGFLEKR